MSTMKAIETRYNGYRFRSRLEARWAVFFDEVGIRYEYEKEGFDLGRLGWYLPDFWLPDLELWVEIKPDLEDAISDGHTKCLSLTQLTKQTSIVIYGNPWPDEYMIIDCKPMDLEAAEIDHGFSEAAWAECLWCDGWWLREHKNGAYRVGPHKCKGEFDRWMPMGEESSLLMSGYRAARSARFEQREQPPKPPVKTAGSRYSMIISIPPSNTPNLIDLMIDLHRLLEASPGKDTVVIRAQHGGSISRWEDSPRVRAAANIFGVAPEVSLDSGWMVIHLETGAKYSATLETKVQALLGTSAMAVIQRN